MALLMPAGCRPSVNSSETTDGQTNPPTASDTTDGEGIREYEIPLTNTQGTHSLFSCSSEWGRISSPLTISALNR